MEMWDDATKYYFEILGIGYNCGYLLNRRKVLVAPRMPKLNLSRNANVVADALSRKERVKPKRVRAMNITLQSSIKDMILVA
nr:putative reverse transcriptase domain-containing protein [Tanacetum cinerariifolium]